MPLRRISERAFSTGSLAAIAALRLLQAADAGEGEAGAEVARLEAQSDSEELGGLLVELALGEAARERHEFLDIGRFRDGHRLSPAARSATMGKF